MEFTNEGYIVTAADLVPGTFVGRFWSADRKTWSSATDRSPASGQSPRRALRLKGLDIRVTNATGGIKTGVRILVFLVSDPLHTEYVLPVLDKIQSASRIVSWLGEAPMCAGIEWRIQQGGVIATDIVSMGVTYEDAHAV
jgi:hypothetical protein